MTGVTPVTVRQEKPGNTGSDEVAEAVGNAEDYPLTACGPGFARTQLAGGR